MKKCMLWVLICLCQGAYAQRYEDKVYFSSIHTVLLYNMNEEQSFPVIGLNSSEKLLLAFDDLSDDTKNLYYTIEHCTADWNSSGLIQNQYLDGFADNPIIDYKFSFNTFQRYTHYEISFPNEQVSLLLSGNYVIKVFADNDHDRLVLTRRFMVIDNRLGIDVSFNRSPVINDRNKKQKLDFIINYGDVRINNPFDEMKVMVLQNYRWDNALYNTRPSFVRANQLEYNHVDANIFDGGNEFRRFDMRSVRFLTERVVKIDEDKTGYQVYIQEDRSRKSDRFITDIDMNGNFYIRRREGNNPSLDADYFTANFRLNMNGYSALGDYYVIGKFNDWKISEENKMKYDADNRVYTWQAYLKQGIYDYEYAFVAKGSRLADSSPTEGSFFETENRYTILVYQRQTGSRYDELIGYKEAVANPR